MDGWEQARSAVAALNPPHGPRSRTRRRARWCGPAACRTAVPGRCGHPDTALHGRDRPAPAGLDHAVLYLGGHNDQVLLYDRQRDHTTWLYAASVTLVHAAG